MLGRFAFVRLKAAENALKDGRLDEAFQIVRADDLRDHRRAQKLLTRLSEQFIARAETHLSNEAFGEALLDLDRADTAGAEKERIVALRNEIRSQADRAQFKRRVRRDRLDSARERLGRGSIAAAKGVLDPASSGDAEANHLRNKADERQRQTQELIAEARALLEAGQFARAVERLVRAQSLDSRDARVLELEGRVAAEIVDVTQSAVREGRLDQARRYLDALGPVAESLPQRQDLSQLLDLAADAAKAIYRHDLHAAKELVDRMRLLAPDVPWIGRVREQLDQAQGAISALRTGPIPLVLGTLATSDAEAPTVVLEGPGIGKPMTSKNKKPTSGKRGAPLPDRLLLIVEGAASFLVLRKERVSIGRINTDDPADVALVSDLSQRHAEISRIEDDYFFSTSQEVAIAGRPVREKLLADGDTIRLNRRTALTFRLPSRRSSSAVLELGDHVRSFGDVRRIVLFNGHASLGASSSCHLNVPVASQRLLLFERNETLWVRPQQSGNSHPGGAPDEAQPLEIGNTVEIAGLGLTLEPAPAPRQTWS